MISDIKRLADALGFDAVGVTPLAALQAGEEAVADWVAQGRHAGMKYMEEFHARKQRLLREFPDARSVIVLGVNYYSSQSSADLLGNRRLMSADKNRGVDGTAFAGDAQEITGRVARYAWGRDYHLVIAQRHQLLIDQIRLFAGKDFKAKSCIDTQPIPERFAAVQAGLGFIGKHTGLLSTRFGPWLFLSEILTNLDLPADLPARGDCGTCTDCQTVCPTGALDADYKIDARLCIAYWTIEHKGIIPREIRPQIKDWLFGCDECFAVCPFTSKSKESRWSELTASHGVGPFIELRELFKIRSNAEYERRFAQTALLRAGRKQMLRNACLVLGNSRNPKALEYLTQALEDPSSLVRLHAVWAVRQIPGAQAAEILKAHRVIERDPDVLLEF